MGTPVFAVPSLAILHGNGYPIVGVVTVPDKPRGRGQEVSSTPVKRFAQSHNLPVLTPASLKDPTFLEQLRSASPDLIVVVAFRILPKEVFTLARLGAFNLHASLLPKYRGAAPINWAIINGETETGVTTFLLQEKVDTGSILLQAKLPIKPDDNAGSIHDKLMEVGAEIVLHTVRLIEQGKAMPKPQESAHASSAPKIFKEDCRIIWNKSAREVHNFIRGLSPSPGAFTFHKGRQIRIFKSSVSAEKAQEPSTVHVAPHALAVDTSDARLEIHELQQEGRKRMTAAEFLRGYRIESGDRFE